MSTDYTHLDKLSFDQLFARKGPDQEILVMDADGNLTVTSVIDVHTVSYYGAVGDGTTNDTVAIQAALTAVPSTGGKVYIPSGSYKITSPLTIKNNTEIFGDGPSSEIKLTGSFATAQRGFIEATDAQNISIHDIKFTGSGSWTSTPFANPYSAGNSVGFTNDDYGIALSKSSTGCDNVSIRNCEFTGLGCAVQIVGADVSTNCQITQNYIHNIGRAAIQLYNCKQLIITDNNIQGIYGNITAAGVTTTTTSDHADGILLVSCTDAVAANNFVYDFIRCGIIVEPGVLATTSTRISIADNVIQHGHDAKNSQFLTGIYIADGGLASPISVSGNVISDMNGGYGIVGEYCTITGGEITDCTNDGIYCVDHVQISGTKIYNCAGSGIKVFASTTVDGCNIQLSTYGIQVSGYAAGDTFTAKNCFIKGNMYAGILLAAASHGTFDISNNYIADNGSGGSPSFVFAGIRITGSYNDQKVVIKGNTFLSSASSAASVGQLYAILGFHGGDFNYTTEYVTNNSFLFTGTLNGYSSSLAVAPCSFAYDTGAGITALEIPNVFGNFNSKLPFGEVDNGATSARFLGHASAAPVSGYHIAGDYYVNSTLASDQPFSFVCTVSGTPGTWENWGGANVTIGTANGLSISNQVLSMTAASSIAIGVVNTSAQSFLGAKTFVNAIAASNFSGTTSGTNTGDVTLGTANGLSISNQVLSLTAASSTAIGVVNTSAQSFLGAKTFVNAIAASNYSGTSSGTNTGDVTLGTANGLSITNQVLTITLASSSAAGVLSTAAQSIAGVKTFANGALILGDTSSSAASTGNIGEFISSYVASGSAVSLSSSAQWVNITSISLTGAGWWTITGAPIVTLGTATGMTQVQGVISTNTGNTTTDHVAGKNLMFTPAVPTGAIDSAVRIDYSIYATGAISVFLKANTALSTGVPKGYGGLEAIRYR